MVYSPPNPPDDRWAIYVVGLVLGLGGLAIFLPASWVLWAVLQ